MTMPADLETDAALLRETMTKALAKDGVLADPAWRAAVETVPRHQFVPGFYLPADERDANGLTVWEPVTAELDYGRWLAATYSDTTLITQFDGDEPDWKAPVARHGGASTSSSTLPSLVVRMWADAEVTEGHTVLEIGTGTGYSTALACERLGSADVTSIEVDPRRLEQAASALYGCGYTPTLAVADGLYGYWPEASFDRIVAACSFRAVPPALLAQTRPGGKILLTLSGWLYGYARVLLTVAEDGTAEGRLLPGTVSFMSARTHAAPAFGNPAHWAAGLPEKPRTTRQSPERITAATEEAFHLRFLAQSAVPDAQMTTVGEVVHLVDVVTGSAATLTPARTAGPCARAAR
ncbi:ATP-grasp peptide maturase system methyltransferase [Streptomyces labedae]|uniref:Protein-L-isoaspartate O-methyltransferase n=1 Tax=Streptomyces labedae TaxID=285569 RepID=A0ABP6R2D6_9ACTN